MLSEDEDEFQDRRQASEEVVDRTAEINEIVTRQMLLSATRQAFDDVDLLFNSTERNIFQRLRRTDSNLLEHRSLAD